MYNTIIEYRGESCGDTNEDNTIYFDVYEDFSFNLFWNQKEEHENRVCMNIKKWEHFHKTLGRLIEDYKEQKEEK